MISLDVIAARTFAHTHGEREREEVDNETGLSNALAICHGLSSLLSQTFEKPVPLPISLSVYVYIQRIFMPVV